MLMVSGLVMIFVVSAVTGFFVAAEFSFVAADRNRLAARAEQGEVGAARALRVTGQLSFMLSGAQLGITVTALLAGFLAEPYLGEGLAELLGVAGVPAAVGTPAAVALALLVATVTQMVLGELAPKNWAIAAPEALACRLSRSVLAYLAVARPLIRIFDVSAVRLLRMVGIEPVEELPQGATADDLDRIIAASEATGDLDPWTSRLLDRGLDFRTRTAQEVMTPRVDVVGIAATEPVARVVKLLDTGRSRFPVYGQDQDDLVGVVGLAEVVTVPARARAVTPVASVASPPLLVPASLPLPVVLERLRTEHRQVACVIDEFGGFAGVISFEDIAEELVGQILGEEDPAEEGARREPDGAWLVPARWRVDEVAEATGLQLPASSAYDSVGGLVNARLGRLPRQGDQIRLVLGPDPRGEDPWEREVVLDVVAVRGRSVRTARISVLVPDRGRK
jgi:CBS domain containing-hemolysin-like protein